MSTISRRRHVAGSWLAAGTMLAFGAPASAQDTVDVREIAPQQSNLHPVDADGASGGRVNGLAVARTDPQQVFAASEWGGLWRSSDGGHNWQHIPGHVPVATWDVKIDPTDARRVYATSFYDGRVQSRSGISVSIDGGVTWNRPASAAPPANFCEEETRREEPSAFGIAIDPANPAHVYVGTNCGLAISRDSGQTWSFIDPSPADGLGAGDVWSVIVHHGGIIDTCGDAGHRRSTTGGATWTAATGANQLPAGRCALGASPYEAHVVFAVVGTTIYETDNGGATWSTAYANPSPQGRIPFVAVNARSGGSYDLWFGDVSLQRRTCTTPQPASPGGSGRCAAGTWSNPFTRQAGGHDDVGTILFDPAANIDACPLLYSSDGGVYFNTRTANPDCHTPAWAQPATTPRATWHWDLAGISLPGVEGEQLYYGVQDNGTFGTMNAGADRPTWSNQHCCDGFNVAADTERVLTIVCCWSGDRAARLWVSSPGLAGPPAEIRTYPPGNLRRFEQLDTLTSLGGGRYLVLTTSGVFVTLNIAADPIVWTQLGAATTPFNACGLNVSTRPATGQITVFVKSGGCDGESGGPLFTYEGITAGGAWKPVRRQGAGLFGVYAADPADPDRVVAADLGGANAPEMVMTKNGGATWTSLPALNRLMVGNGAFRPMTRRGPIRWTLFSAYPQPTLVAFDPHDSNTMVAAGADSGVFFSRDGGVNWTLLTDPDNPLQSGRPHIPRARYVHFGHDEGGALRMYIATQGRGVWRVRIGPGQEPVSAAPPALLPSPAGVPQPDIAPPSAAPAPR
jgi:photosystem II stability/assembly factor-like uncharacterized protein